MTENYIMRAKREEFLGYWRVFFFTVELPGMKFGVLTEAKCWL